jgi:ETFB lysine methyltransferase
MRLIEHRFRYGPLDLSVMAAADLDALLTDDLDPEQIPFWSVLWTSAGGLARKLVEQGGWSGIPILEVGCGAGLAGLAAAALGARVTQTDLSPEAVRLARLNAERNGLSGIHRAAADWRVWPLQGSWPVVLGSDVAYERAAHGALLEVLNQAVAPGGMAYLSDPDRPMSLDFFARAEAEGWRVGIEEAPPESSEAPAFIYTLQH